MYTEKRATYHALHPAFCVFPIYVTRINQIPYSSCYGANKSRDISLLSDYHREIIQLKPERKP